MYSDNLNFGDVRKKRRYDPRHVRAVVAASNRFNRNLLLEILRTLGALQVDGARTEKDLIRVVDDQRCNVMLVEWGEDDAMNSVELVKRIRSMNDDALRRIPIIAISSQLTKEMVLAGRNAGIDEFLRRPCSPADVQKRLRMVIETPRPFIDSSVYIGPCRRRKNPADYHGPRRRDRDNGAQIKDLTDAERQLVDQTSQLTIALKTLKMSCALMSSDPKGAPTRIRSAIAKARQAGKQENDSSFLRVLEAFEAFMEILFHSPKAAKDTRFIVNTGITTLEQLLVLPSEYESARTTVANAFSDAIHRRMAA